MTVKCADCGFLSLRDLASGELYSPATTYRETGETPVAEYRPSPFPICLMRACDFRKELSVEREGHIVARDALLKSLHLERQCEKFTTWHQGFSPKEHAELLMFEEQHKWQKEQARWNFFATMGAAAIGFVAALLAVLVARWIQ